MAKNYTIKEACEIIAKGTDFEAITDIGRRYPVLAHKLAVLTAKAGDEVVDLMGYMPEYLSANKVNSAIKKSIEGGASEDEAEDDAAETEETTEDAGEDTATAEWNENMSAKQLWDILGKAGKRKLAKSTKKADLVEACKQAFGAGASEDADDEADEAEATEEAGAYDGKSAMELFKECKKRGIKAPAKKPAKFYADLLTKDDAKTEETAEAEGDDEWDEEPAEETKAPAKKAAAGKKAPAKKAAKKEEESEDDDWDI